MKRYILLLSVLLGLGIISAYVTAGSARPPGFCQNHPNHPKCHTTSSSSSSSSSSSTTISSSSSTSTTIPTPTRQYFGTVTSGVFPRSNTYCADHILIDNWEPASRGNMPYNVPRDDLATPYDSWWTSFPNWLSLRAQVDGHFVNSDGSIPTTTEIFSFAACKWGIDENLMRAVAVQESDWRERFIGDVCGPVGQASYGIMQIKNRNCANEGDWGGYPRTYNSTTYNVDFYGAAFRGCLNKVFWYNYGTATDLTHGCVGAWFAGSFQPNSTYTNSVYTHLANKDWLNYG